MPRQTTISKISDPSLGILPPRAYAMSEQKLRTQQQADRLAQEQWNWQKKLYGEQQEATKTMAGNLSGAVGGYNTAWERARAANEARYQEMLGITGETTQQRATDIRAGGVGEEANIMQQLQRQGMAGTTVAPTMRAGVRRETESSLNRLADMMQGTKLGIMERKVDKYPDPNMLTSLITALGQSGGPTGAASAFKAMSGMRFG